MARALGIGGYFRKSADPVQLAAWYERHLGMAFSGQTFAKFAHSDLPAGSYAVWAAFPKESDYFGPSAEPAMLNLIVDDLDGALRQVAEGGANCVGGIQSSEYGRFGWFIDPDGHKVELWEPA